YSGVILEWTGRGYSVYEYDRVAGKFSIIPRDTLKRKVRVDFNEQISVTKYLDGTGTTTTVDYGTIFSSRQQVYDFLISFQRWLESEGWEFVDRSDNQSVDFAF